MNIEHSSRRFFTRKILLSSLLATSLLTSIGAFVLPVPVFHLDFAYAQESTPPVESIEINDGVDATYDPNVKVTMSCDDGEGGSGCGKIQLTFFNADANTNPTAQDSFNIHVSSDSDLVGEDFVASETGINSGDFVLPIQLSSETSVGFIAFIDGDQLYATGTFFDSAPGPKTIDATFSDADANEVSDSASIDLLAPNYDFFKQFGTEDDDIANDVKVHSTGDSPGIYVVGETRGDLDGEGPVGFNGGSDAFIQEFSLDGQSVTWTDEFGGTGADAANAVAVGSDGVYVAGKTYSATSGDDAFVRKYSFGGGEPLWTFQFDSTTGGYDSIQDIAIVSSGDYAGIYVAGYTNGIFGDFTGTDSLDAFVAKINLAGDAIAWLNQTRADEDDVAEALAINTNSVYVTGYTKGTSFGTNVGDADIFVWQLGLDGSNDGLKRDFGTLGADFANGIALDSSHIYVTGETEGDLNLADDSDNQGLFDGFVRQLNIADGTEVWTDQFGTGSNDIGYDVATDLSTGIYVVGSTRGSIGESLGGSDAILRNYDFDGSLKSSDQFGTANDDIATSVDLDSAGVYVAGQADASGGEGAVGDAFVSQFDLGPAGDSIEITSVDPAYWGIKVGVSGTTTVLYGVVSIDWGDGSDPTTGIPVDSEDGSWSLAPEDGHAYSSEDVGGSFDIVATVTDTGCECDHEVSSAPVSTEVLKHTTAVDLDFINEQNDPSSHDLESVPQGAKYSVTGTLFDTVGGDTLTQVGGKQITFGTAEAGPLPSVTAKGLIFQHTTGGTIEVVACPNSPTNCSEDIPDIFGPDVGDDGANNVVHLEVGGEIIFPVNTLDASIYLQDVGYNTVKFEVYDQNGLDHQGEVVGAGGGACVIPVLQTHAGTTTVAGKKVPQPITKIKITQVLSDPDLSDPDLCGPAALTNGPSPAVSIADGSIGIAAIVTHVIDGQDPFTKQLITSFEGESAGIKTSPFEVEPGRFFSTGLATAPAGQNYQVQASFAGDTKYEPSTSTIGEIDVTSARGGLTSASAGSVTTSPAPDNGNDFVTYSCAAGNDVDGDALCDNWEQTGIVDVGGASLILPEADSANQFKDIYVEVDAMAGGYALTTTELNDLKAVFTNAPLAPNGLPYKLHIDTSVGSSRVDLQACKLEYSIVSPK